jgi:hypothetical protein
MVHTYDPTACSPLPIAIWLGLCVSEIQLISRLVQNNNRALTYCAGFDDIDMTRRRGSGLIPNGGVPCRLKAGSQSFQLGEAMVHNCRVPLYVDDRWLPLFSSMATNVLKSLWTCLTSGCLATIRMCQHRTDFFPGTKINRGALRRAASYEHPIDCRRSQ